jgi:hypothetical protein
MGQEAKEGWERRQTELLSKHSVLGSHGRTGPTGWPSRLYGDLARKITTPSRAEPIAHYGGTGGTRAVRKTPHTRAYISSRRVV